MCAFTTRETENWTNGNYSNGKHSNGMSSNTNNNYHIKLVRVRLERDVVALCITLLRWME